MAVANEGPFGVTRMCEHAIWDDLPKIACVQQEYNLFTQNKVEMGERAILSFSVSAFCRSKPQDVVLCGSSFTSINAMIKSIYSSYLVLIFSVCCCSCFCFQCFFVFHFLRVFVSVWFFSIHLVFTSLFRLYRFSCVEYTSAIPSYIYMFHVFYVLAFKVFSVQSSSFRMLVLCSSSRYVPALYYLRGSLCATYPPPSSSTPPLVPSIFPVPFSSLDGGFPDLVEACAPRQENVAIIATQTLGGGALSTKYMYERNLWDRVSPVGPDFMSRVLSVGRHCHFICLFVCLSFCLCICLSICPAVSFPASLFSCMPVCLSVCLSLCLPSVSSVCLLPVYLSTSLSSCLSMPVCLHARLSGVVFWLKHTTHFGNTINLGALT